MLTARSAVDAHINRSQKFNLTLRQLDIRHRNKNAGTPREGWLYDWSF